MRFCYEARVVTRGCLSMLMGSLGACAGPTGAASPGGQGGPALAVALQVRTGEGTDAHAVAPGATLHDGELLRIELAVSKPAHIYVVQASADHPRELLYGSEDTLPLQPGQTLSLPEGAPGLRLEGTPGDESLTVIATKAPLCRQDRRLADTYQIPCVGLRGERKDPPPPPPPPPVTTSTRGRDLLTSPDSAIVRASGTRGVAILRFPFRHVP